MLNGKHLCNSERKILEGTSDAFKIYINPYFYGNGTVSEFNLPVHLSDHFLYCWKPPSGPLFSNQSQASWRIMELSRDLLF